MIRKTNFAALILLGVLLPLSLIRAEEKPNIVFVLADDWGIGDVKCFGGDLCRIDPTHWQVHFQGRIDAQFKVRGHRVEAQGIESQLQDTVTAIETAVVDFRHDELIAFVLAP